MSKKPGYQGLQMFDASKEAPPLEEAGELAGEEARAAAFARWVEGGGRLEDAPEGALEGEDRAAPLLARISFLEGELAAREKERAKEREERRAIVNDAGGEIARLHRVLAAAQEISEERRERLLIRERESEALATENKNLFRELAEARRLLEGRSQDLAASSKVEFDLEEKEKELAITRSLLEEQIGIGARLLREEREKAGSELAQLGERYERELALKNQEYARVAGLLAAAPGEGDLALAAGEIARLEGALSKASEALKAREREIDLRNQDLDSTEKELADARRLLAKTEEARDSFASDRDRLAARLDSAGLQWQREKERADRLFQENLELAAGVDSSPQRAAAALLSFLVSEEGALEARLAKVRGVKTFISELRASLPSR